MVLASAAPWGPHHATSSPEIPHTRCRTEGDPRNLATTKGYPDCRFFSGVLHWVLISGGLKCWDPTGAKANMNLPVTCIPPIHQSHSLKWFYVTVLERLPVTPRKGFAWTCCTWPRAVAAWHLGWSKPKCLVQLHCTTAWLVQARPGSSCFCGCPTLANWWCNWCNLARLQSWQHSWKSKLTVMEE